MDLSILNAQKFLVANTYNQAPVVEFYEAIGIYVKALQRVLELTDLIINKTDVHNSFVNVNAILEEFLKHISSTFNQEDESQILIQQLLNHLNTAYQQFNLFFVKESLGHHENLELSIKAAINILNILQRGVT